MGETEVTANNVTKLIARYWERALAPHDITYTTRRTAAERQLYLTIRHDGSDGDDGKFPV